ncbi:hypothetical protein TPV1_gp07 [Thermococcus prieurii virus 1]|uniref:hypothetical protein n=1 Tax=Thermococcus prieurii virus 1 TaxID=1115696 RepID=UPI00024FB20D|nr:hypothetical protein TPV1_gp07 [Thermococcus prieurii virus 1]AEY69056.1 hypothetical protein [Thermococcus prieurii virus 1]AFA44819.1 hypothetical protein [Thermococcus prieurii virus 1]
MVEVYCHLSAEEAEKIALEIYNRYKAEVDKKWEQFKKEMEGVPPEILYDQELWEDWMMDRWIQLVDEIDYLSILEEYRKRGISVFLEHEEDIRVVVESSGFRIEVVNGEPNFEWGGFRSWKYSPNWNSARRIDLLRAWMGFARLFYPEGFDRGAFDHDLWLELEVYWDMWANGAWKEGGGNSLWDVA